MIDRFAATDAGTLAISACIALVSAWGGTALARRAAHAMGMVSQPNPIVPQHTRSTAYLGGVGVALGIAAAATFTYLSVGSSDDDYSFGQSAAILGGATAFLVLGVLDDRRAFGAAAKFGLQAIVAAVVVSLGICAPVCGVPLIDCLASWFWICMLVNAFNFVDVSDGLLASVSACVFAALAAVFPPVAALAIPASAACIGFLPRNHPPATIFLGDAGSHLLGFLAAALTIVGVGGCSSPVAGVVVSSIILIVPLFELCFITAARVRKGLPWWKGSPDHFALRMQAEGFTRLQVNAIAVGATCLASLVAIAAQALSNHYVFLVALVVLFAVVPCWRRLDVMGQCTK